VLSVGGTGGYWGNRALHRMQQLKALDQARVALLATCTARTYPTGTLVFDEAADAFVTSPRGQNPHHLVRPPARQLPWTNWSNRWDLGCWGPSRTDDGRTGAVRQLWSKHCEWNDRVQCGSGLMPAYIYSLPLEADEVFTHGRRCAGGAERLVVVGFDPPAFMNGSDRPFRVWVMRRTGAWSSLDCQANGEEFRFVVRPSQPLKLYAGVADPTDGSRFTIDYETPEGRGVIGGWLQPDDRVKLQVRSGPASELAH
jgi:hypothetical protein